MSPARPAGVVALAVLASAAFGQDGAAGEKEPEKPAPEASPPPALFEGSAEDLAATHANVSVAEIGRSRGGRPLVVVTVRPKDETDADVEWEALVVAGLEGLRNREESRLALDVAARLAGRPDALPPHCAVRVLLDGNPDATAFTQGARIRSGNDLAVDEDQDGDADEDGPDDVDGDGRISWMRFPDPTGDRHVTVDDKGVPAMETADVAKGLQPTHRLVREGRDDDGDGLWNEDAAGGVDIARNFTWRFDEHVPECGRWPASEPETRAILDFLLADERVAAVFEFGDAETVAGMPGWGGAWTRLPDSDVALLGGLREAFPTGGKSPPHKERAPAAGSLGLAVLHHLGRIWFGRAPLGVGGESSIASRAPAYLRKWRPVAGPGLPDGAELCDPDPRPDPEMGNLAIESQPAADFLALLARSRAKIEFRGTVAAGGAGVLTLTTRLVNTGRLPTHTQRGAEVKGRRPVNVRVRLPQGATLEAGKPLVQIERIAGGEETEPLLYVVRGPSGAKVAVEATGPDTGTVATEAVIP